MATERRIETTYTLRDTTSNEAVKSRRAHSRFRRTLPGWILLPLSLLAGIALWELAVRAGNYPAYLLPAPGRVASRFVSAIEQGIWWRHTRMTLLESVLGFALGFAVAVVLGYALARWRPLERTLTPYIAGSQSLPIVAIAPLIVLWFGYGLFPRVLVCALIVFFPILVNTLVGLRNVPKDLIEVAQVYGASAWQRLWMVELPLALPVLLGGVRLGLTLSITGAVVSEFVGSDVGLGVLLNISNGLFDTPLMFVALVTLVGMAASFYAVATLLDRMFLDWLGR